MNRDRLIERIEGFVIHPAIQEQAKRFLSRLPDEFPEPDGMDELIHRYAPNRILFRWASLLSIMCQSRGIRWSYFSPGGSTAAGSVPPGDKDICVPFLATALAETYRALMRAELGLTPDR